MPQVRDLFAKNPEYSNIDTLGAIGEEEDLKTMLLGIPKLVDLKARKDIPRSATNVFDPAHKNNMEYAQIVKHLGRLHTPDSIEQIKVAARDYDPQV